LGNVISHSRVAAHAQRETVDCGMFLPIEVRKRILISGHNSPEQTLVREIGRLGHLFDYGRPHYPSSHIPGWAGKGSRNPCAAGWRAIECLEQACCSWWLRLHIHIRLLDQSAAVQ
jgi:hypothetical protein